MLFHLFSLKSQNRCIRRSLGHCIGSSFGHCIERSFGSKSDFCESLLQFKELYGHTIVPKRFVTPVGDSRWPEYCQGKKLGEFVAKCRKLHNSKKIEPHLYMELNKLDFAWDIDTYKWERRILPALTAYHKIKGNLLIPNKFEIPSEDPWPENLYGFKLGDLVKNIRAYSCFVRGNEQRKHQLECLGFIWKPNETRFDTLIYPSLVIYKQLYADLSIAQDFVIPSNDPWKEEMYGLPLGEIVKAIRSQGCFIRGSNKRKQMLENLNFVWNHYDARFNEMIVPALWTYKELYGNLLVSKGFVVPFEDPWPNITRGLALGETVMSIRSQGCYVHNEERRKRLDDMGFSWAFNESKWIDIAFPAIQMYKELHGTLSLPKNYIVPNKEPWPQLCRRFPLGEYVSNLKAVKDHSKIKLIGALGIRVQDNN